MVKQLWAPWRASYLTTPRSEGCILCNIPNNPDQEYLVKSYEHCFVTLNKFPYISGHVMIVPYRHLGQYPTLPGPVAKEIFEVSQRLVDIFIKKMDIDGCNIGWNIGNAAGAGIVDHLHMHVVPRWNGDTNFLPVLADCRVISEHLQSTRDNLRSYLEVS